MKSPPLVPDDIRTFRKGLGLTQREAGELLGGGPKAFAKYETGERTPSTACNNLLRVLRANPSALNTLRPERADHVPTALPLPFEVTSQHWAAITRQKFPEFIRSLLWTEASSYGVQNPDIHVADNIDAPDGGEDGRISWEEGPAQTPFLPGRFCQFQLKTGAFKPSDAGKEVLTTEGEIKPRIRSALENEGHYIILVTNPYTQQQIEDSKGRIRRALRGAGLDIGDDRIHFYPAEKLSDWVNCHPTMAHRLLEIAEPGLRGPFQSWGHWNIEHKSSPWVGDERLDKLRQFLQETVGIAQPRSVARVVGLAGIGKSRLVLEATGTLGNLVMYAVEGVAGSEDIRSTVWKLAASGKRAIVIVDDCAPETHRVLASMASLETSQLSLLTLDSEVLTETQSGSPALHEVEEASLSVIDDMVSRIATDLQDLDRRRLVRFARGVPGIAITLAQAWNRSMSLALATDEELIDPYVLGRTRREPELLLKSAALLAAFGLVGIDIEADDQLTKIAGLGRHLSPDDLRVGAKRLAARKLVAQRRGRYVAIKPSPITMRLAERQWAEEWSKDTWDTVLADNSASTSFADDLRLNVQAAKQLRSLNSSDVSKAVVNHVCRFGGPFFGPDKLLVEGYAEVLSLLAEIDTGIIADLLKYSLVKVEDLSSIVGETRMHLVWALGKIAFKADTFDDGARLLLCLAAATKADEDNATEQFVSLFPLRLGNTEADGTQRLDLLDSLSKTDDTLRKEIVIRALTAGLELEHFTRDVGPEVHGTRPALSSWCPETREEACAYVRGCATQLIAFATQSDDIGALARSCLGPNLAALIQVDFIDIAELAVEQVGAAVEHWPEARNTLGLYLSRCCTDEPSELVDRIQAMMDRLTPTSLETRVRFLVTDTPWEYLNTGNDSYEEQQQRWEKAVRELAAEVVQQPNTLQALLPQLSRGHQQMVREFGRGIADFAGSWDDWLEPIILEVEKTPETERDYGLLMGYVQGFADDQPDAVEAFKRRAAKSSTLAPALPLICSNLGLSPSDIALLVDALEDGLLPPECLTWNSLGMGLKRIPPVEMFPLLDAMLDHSREGFAGALELLGLYVSGNLNGLEDFCLQIRKIADNALRWPWRNLSNLNNARHYFDDILTWMLERGPDDPEASATARALAKAAVNVTDYNHTHTLATVLPILLSRFLGVVWPLIGSAIVGDDPRQRLFFETMLRSPSWLDCGETCAPILKLPEDTLFAWCRTHPERALVFVAKTVPFLLSDGNTDDGFRVHPVMMQLIEEFGSREDLIDAVVTAMWTKVRPMPEEHLWIICREQVTKLLPHPHPNVRRWAKVMLRRLGELIDQSRVRDAEVEARMED